ncbi:MAG: mechanosensitive ion channel [Chlamydiia bacterium]|nr:mechanosensitive ion channel [Chlamydiia bacterium]
MIRRLLPLCLLFFHFLYASESVDNTRKELNKIDKNLNEIRIELLDLSQLSLTKIYQFRTDIQQMVVQLNTIRVSSEKDLLTVQSMLDDLGPAPAEGDIPEDSEMAAQRMQLKTKEAFYHNRVKRIKALIARSQTIQIDVNQTELKLRVYLLKWRSSPIYELQGDEEGFTKISKFFDPAYGAIALQFFQSVVTKKGIFVGITFILVGVFLVLIRRPLKKRYIIEDETISDAYKLKEAAVDFFTDGIVPSAVGFLFLAYLKILNVFPENLFSFIFSIFCLVGGLWIYLVLVRVIFRSDLPSHRIFQLEDHLANSLSVRLSWAGPLLALTLWFRGIDLSVDLPEDFADYVRIILQTALCVNLLFLLDAKIWGFLNHVSKWLSTCFRYVAGLILVSVPVLLFVGYVAFAEYLLMNLLQSVLLISLLLLGFVLIRSAIDSLISQSSVLFKKFSIKQRAITLLRYWLIGLVAFSLWITAIIGLLYIWGIGSSFVVYFLQKLYYGFEISGQRISIALVVLAIFAFIISYMLINAAMHFLDKHVFPYTTMQKGLSEALKTIIRYIFIVIAFILCVRILGFKLTSLAYIAGGLSVGVGLGLQPIIMNFISGIIMLIERPVRVGDQLEVSGEMGIVTKISVRATQIRTFDHALYMIPNSHLITNIVKNWTWESPIRRIEIAVDVAYGSDVEKVIQLLYEVAAELECGLVQPAPFVVFNGFGDSNLNFLLKVCIGNIADTLKARTEIHLAITRKFKEQGITIAYPQRDIHIKQEQLDV